MFEITVYDEKMENSVEAAFKEAGRLWQWGMEGAFKSFASEELEKQLDEFGRCLAENGGLHLINTERCNIPTDCFIDVDLKPTYVAGAVYIYAYNTQKALFKNERYLKCLGKILKACLVRDFYDHGYEAEAGKLDNMLLFARAGVKDFLEKHPKEGNEFCNFLSVEYKKLEEELQKCKEQNQEFTVMGFGEIVADSQAEAIVELMGEIV